MCQKISSLPHWIVEAAVISPQLYAPLIAHLKFCQEYHLCFLFFFNWKILYKEMMTKISKFATQDYDPFNRNHRRSAPTETKPPGPSIAMEE